MSREEKIQHAEELHAKGQFTNAELEAMRIKIAAQEEFDRLQAYGQEAQRSELPKGNGQERTHQEVDVQETKSL